MTPVIVAAAVAVAAAVVVVVKMIHSWFWIERQRRFYR